MSRFFALSVLICLAAAYSSAVQAQKPEFDTELNVVETRFKIAFNSDLLKQRSDLILPWIQHSAEVVTAYFGTFPMEEVEVVFHPVDGYQVQSGWVFGSPKAMINIRIGNRVVEEALTSDWVMVHEMIHLAFPNVSQRWIKEGMATYLESITRVAAGDLSSEFVWREFMRRMPQGQPTRGDQGLDATPTWGRTFWGGAAFCLLADLKIQQQTDYRYGLRDALRGILDAGFNMSREPDLEMVFAIGDKAIGNTVLTDLYQRYGLASEAYDLDQLWLDLGLQLDGDQLVIKDDAPWAEARRRIASLE